MKITITILSLLLSLHCLSQTPNPELFRTWYLYDYYSTDDNIHHPVSAVTPAISPNITFTETLGFSGIGACNYFYGNFSAPSNDTIVFNDFSATLLQCNASSHISFEGAYFGLMYPGSAGQYFIFGQGNQMSLLISTPIFNNYVFGALPLDIANFDLNQTMLYPNPVDSQLFVNSYSNTITKIELLNSLGQIVKTVTDDFDQINLSEMASGIYFLKLYSGETSVSKKIIKR